MTCCSGSWMPPPSRPRSSACGRYRAPRCGGAGKPNSGALRPRACPETLSRRMIANRIQEQAFGTLDRATLKLLDGLARRDGARRGERNLKIGTVLVRDYQGRRHTVTVAPEGYVLGGWKRSGAMLGTFAIVVMMPLLLS